MRPTLLGFRHPDERTAEYSAECRITNDGTKIKLADRRKQSVKGTNLPKDTRFKAMPFYDRGTGQSVFLGPGSYNSQESFVKLKATPCPTIIVS